MTFMPHPNARAQRTFGACVSERELRAVRAFCGRRSVRRRAAVQPGPAIGVVVTGRSPVLTHASCAGPSPFALCTRLRRHRMPQLCEERP